jgi:dipeptidyl aminopeptidase/acylaminoacyl peptidase
MSVGTSDARNLRDEARIIAFARVPPQAETGRPGDLTGAVAGLYAHASMPIPRPRAAALLVPALLAGGGSLAARPLTLDDTLAFARIAAIDVSPDGLSVVACVERRVPGENRFATDLVLAPTDGGAPERSLTGAPGEDCDPRFSPDGRFIAFLSDRAGTTQIFILPVGGGEATQATHHAEAVATFAWSVDGRSLFYTAAAPCTPEELARRERGDDAWVHGEEWRPHRLWSLPVPASAGGSLGGEPARPLTGGSLHVTDRPVVSPDGRLLAFVAQPTPEADASEESAIEVLDLSRGTLIEVPGSRRAASPVWGRGRSGGTLFFTRPFDSAGWSRADLFSWKPGDAAPGDRSAALDRDVEQIEVTPAGTVEVTYSRGAITEIATVTGDLPTPAWKPGYAIAWPTNLSGGRVFVRLDRPHEIWRADRRGVARPITRLNADRVAGIDLPPMETVRWRSGPWEIEGVLTLPARAADGPQAARAPLLVRPHGGPRSHSLMEWSAQDAWFASLGYLVLEPNFRGSTGYGDAFAKGNGGDWGTGPFADVMAGVDALIAAGRADPERLFLFGWSYGGILANWAAVHSDRFDAVVSGAGVADLRLQYILSDARRWRFDYFGGSPFLPEHLPLYWENSPVTGVRKTGTPVLFIQGEADRRCPLPQALMMHRALLDAGGRSTLVIYPREGHLFREPAHLLDRSRRIAEFLAAQGGMPVPAPRD